MFFIFEQVKETVLIFFTRDRGKTVILFYFNVKSYARYFIQDGPQNYFIFQSFPKYFQGSRTIVNVKVMR